VRQALFPRLRSYRALLLKPKMLPEPMSSKYFSLCRPRRARRLETLVIDEDLIPVLYGTLETLTVLARSK
jgi:hypothetical protein